MFSLLVVTRADPIIEIYCIRADNTIPNFDTIHSVTRQCTSTLSSDSTSFFTTNVSADMNLYITTFASKVSKGRVRLYTTPREASKIVLLRCACMQLDLFRAMKRSTSMVLRDKGDYSYFRIPKWKSRKSTASIWHDGSYVLCFGTAPSESHASPLSPLYRQLVRSMSMVWTRMTCWRSTQPYSPTQNQPVSVTMCEFMTCAISLLR